MTSNEPSNKKSKNKKPTSKANLKDKSRTEITADSPPSNQQKELEEESKKMEEAEIKKHVELEKQIKEIQDKLNFEQQQCQNIINLKLKEKEQKEKDIEQLKLANLELNEQLKYLKKQVKENFDLFSKEKDDKDKEPNTLEEMYKVKEEELMHYINTNKQKEKEKERLKKELDSKVNLEEVTNLQNQIKVSKNKKKELEKLILELEPIRLQHEKCEKEKARIKNEIYSLQKTMEDIKKTNRKKFIKETKDKRLVIKHNNMSKKFKNLDEEQINNLKEEINQKKIDKYWEKEKEIESSNDTDNDMRKKDEDDKKNVKKLKYMPEGYLDIVQKKQNFNNKMEFSKNVRNNSHKKEIESSDLQKTEFPIIPLFGQNKKKALLNIIPENHIQKFEKRYECIIKEKEKLIRKKNTETRQLKTEQNILSKNYESFLERLNDNKNENQLLESKISEQEKKLVKLKNKLNKLKDYLQKTKDDISNQEKINRELVEELQRFPNEENNERAESGEEEVDNNQGQKAKKQKKEKGNDESKNDEVSDEQKNGDEEEKEKKEEDEEDN